MAGFHYQAGNLTLWNSEICTYAQEDIRHGVLWKCRLNQVYFSPSPPLLHHSSSSSSSSRHIRGLNCHTCLVFIFSTKAVSSEMALHSAGGSPATWASRLSSFKHILRMQGNIFAMPFRQRPRYVFWQSSRVSSIYSIMIVRIIIVIIKLLSRDSVSLLGACLWTTGASVAAVPQAASGSDFTVRLRCIRNPSAIIYFKEKTATSCGYKQMVSCCHGKKLCVLFPL